MNVRGHGGAAAGDRRALGAGSQGENRLKRDISKGGSEMKKGGFLLGTLLIGVLLYTVTLRADAQTENEKEIRALVTNGASSPPMKSRTYRNGNRTGGLCSYNVEGT